jgi:hypothetical protein
MLAEKAKFTQAEIDSTLLSALVTELGAPLSEDRVDFSKISEF